MPNLPAFAQAIVLADEMARSTLLEQVHVDYDLSVAQWQVLLDAFEGSGGFADGDYLWPYRHETAEDFRKRQKSARYHNYVEAIVDLYVRHLFSQTPTRQTKNKELEEFWNDVDGAGTDISTFLRKAMTLALAGAHVGILCDMTQDAPAGPAKADQQARPILSLFTSVSILDWRLRADELIGVKLKESVPAVGIAEETPEGEEAFQLLLWDEEGWARFNHKGELIDGDVPGLGLVPLVVLRPKPSVLRSFIGRPLFSNAQIIQALYNRMSELDSVQRDQAFSLFTVNVGKEGDVKSARDQLGTTWGASYAVVSTGDMDFKSPDMAIPAELRESCKDIIREIYRVAHMRFQRESLDAESAEAIRLQYTELNEMLQGCAAALVHVENQIARFFFAWKALSPEQAEKDFEAAEVTVEYADEFFLDDLLTDLTAWAQALKFGLGETMTKRIKKRAVRRIEPEMPDDVLEQIDAEIDAMDEDAMGIGGMGEDMRQVAMDTLKRTQLQDMGVEMPEKDRILATGGTA